MFIKKINDGEIPTGFRIIRELRTETLTKDQAEAIAAIFSIDADLVFEIHINGQEVTLISAVTEEN